MGLKDESVGFWKIICLFWFVYWKIIIFVLVEFLGFIFWMWVFGLIMNRCCCYCVGL